MLVVVVVAAVGTCPDWVHSSRPLSAAAAAAAVVAVVDSSSWDMPSDRDGAASLAAAFDTFAHACS